MWGQNMREREGAISREGGEGGRRRGSCAPPCFATVRALKQQHLPTSIGGNGVHDNAGCCAAEWVSSAVGSLATVREFVPRLATIDVLWEFPRV